MTGVYSIIPRVRTPSINAGDPIEIDVFLTGYGDPAKDNKLQISYSSPILARDENGKVGFVETCIKVAQDRDGKIVGALTGNAEWKDPKTNEVSRALDRRPLDPIGMAVTLNAGYFLKVKEVDRLAGKEVDERSTQLLSELVHSGRAPLFLKFNTLLNARAGDHEIFLTLLYSVGSEKKMDQKVLEIHINSWFEKHQKKLQWIAVILGLSALSAAIIQAVFTVL